MINAIPRYPHHVENCVFLGQYGKYDLYFYETPQDPLLVMARSGPALADYILSILWSSSEEPALCEAKRRFYARGLLTMGQRDRVASAAGIASLVFVIILMGSFTFLAFTPSYNKAYNLFPLGASVMQLVWSYTIGRRVMGNTFCNWLRGKK